MKRATAVTLMFLSCGRAPNPIVTIEPPSHTLDAGQPNACNVPFGGPNCCDGAAHVGNATCQAGEYACTQGAICACANQPQTFWCTDFCGSDAYVSPTCGQDGWLCPAGLIATSSCDPGTCWGEPGCTAHCEAGKWICDDGDGGINDPV